MPEPIDLTDLSDLELIRRFKDGSEQCFDALYRRYVEKIHKFIYFMIGSPERARDITQDVFVKVYCKVALFKPKAQFSTWLYTVAKNTALREIEKNRDLYRGLRLDACVSDPDLLLKNRVDRHAKPENPNPQSQAIAKEEQALVRAGLLKLDLDTREILVLCDIGEQPHKEVAAILGCSEKTLNVKLHRARIKLSKVIGIKDEYFS